MTNKTDFFELKPSQTLEKCEKSQIALAKRGLDYFYYYVLPAAGPKAFVSCGFEYQLKAAYESNSLSGSKWFIGGSTGALRACAFIAGILKNEDLTLKLKDKYCKMYYKDGDTPQVLYPMMHDLIYTCLPTDIVERVLQHKDFKMAIFVTGVHPIVSKLPLFISKLFFGALVIGNCINSSVPKLMSKTICFYSGTEPPPFLKLDNSIEFTRLVPDNIYQVLHATTCIPFVSVPCTHIFGRPPGTFYDGGILNYYLNIRLGNPTLPGMLLGDLHPNEPIHATALDALLPSFMGRSVPKNYLEHCSVVRPTHRYTLEVGRLPAVNDWFNPEYILDPTLRHKHWNTAFNLSKQNWLDFYNFSINKQSA